MEQWRCAYCETLNGVTDTFCAVCHEPRRDAAPVEPVRVLPSFVDTKPAVDPAPYKPPQPKPFSPTTVSPVLKRPLSLDGTPITPKSGDSVYRYHTSSGKPLTPPLEYREQLLKTEAKPSKKVAGTVILMLISLLAAIALWTFYQNGVFSSVHINGNADVWYDTTATTSDASTDSSVDWTSWQTSEADATPDAMASTVTQGNAYLSSFDTPAEATASQGDSAVTQSLEGFTVTAFDTPLFPDGGLFAVYTGPGGNYLRGANGKARVGTNGWIRVYGTDGDWALVEYSITDDQWRQGYIAKVNLPADVQVEPLLWARVAGKLSIACDLTDDPNCARQPLCSLANNLPVTLLATCRDMVYIECRHQNSMVRGYVPLSAVTLA